MNFIHARCSVVQINGRRGLGCVFTSGYGLIMLDMREDSIDEDGSDESDDDA
eukprot:SAG31_NODE_29456_length_395_cov_0.699324_1_plen_52_part_00